MDGSSPDAGAADDFRDGIEHYAAPCDLLRGALATPAIAENEAAIRYPASPAAVFQTLLLADALRFLTLQLTGSKSSGHAGGFASQAEVFAALVMLGHKNILTEAGHHAPGFYSALFLDRSLEKMGIRTVRTMCERFRERDGSLGHPSGQIPGILAPAGPLGQGQHFAMAAALLHPRTLFPVTIGDGGMDEPYTLSSMQHFLAAFPDVTNFLPVLVWNGFSQVGFARLAGLPVGIVGNNSKVKSGAILPGSCKKMSKFISLCDAFSIPLVFLADTPGFGVGIGLDEAGAIKLAAQVSKLLARSTVPKALVIVRNAFGGGMFMAGPGLVDTVVAFPEAKIGPFGALTIRPPETPHEVEALVDMKDLSDMRRLLQRGLLDDIVEPASLRGYLVRFLRAQTRTPPASPRGVLCI